MLRQLKQFFYFYACFYKKYISVLNAKPKRHLYIHLYHFKFCQGETNPLPPYFYSMVVLNEKKFQVSSLQRLEEKPMKTSCCILVVLLGSDTVLWVSQDLNVYTVQCSL